ncbi:MAG: hypothetical protein ACFFCW_10935 [Candidatus Hodarchaeota archaeon]
MTERKDSMGEGARYIALASEIVVLSLIGLFLGQALGEKLGPPYYTLGVVIGVLGGFLVAAYSIYKTVERLEKKPHIQIGKKICPECLRGISAVLEECPYCGYRRSQKTED